MHIEDGEGWWLSSCHSSVREHWLYKPGVLGLIHGDYWSSNFPLFLLQSHLKFFLAYLFLSTGYLVIMCNVQLQPATDTIDHITVVPCTFHPVPVMWLMSHVVVSYILRDQTVIWNRYHTVIILMMRHYYNYLLVVSITKRDHIGKAVKYMWCVYNSIMKLSLLSIHTAGWTLLHAENYWTINQNNSTIDFCSTFATHALYLRMKSLVV